MTVSFEPVATWPQAQELRCLRNDCRQWMTGDTSEISAGRQRVFFEQQLLPGKVRAWLLRENGRAAGYALLRPGDDGALWMSCGVGPGARGRGLGTLLVQFVTAAGRYLGGPVRLEVRQDNMRARLVYGDAGYVATGTRQQPGSGGMIVEMEHRR